MPSILIEVRKTYTPEQEEAIMEAVHNALLTSFKTRPQDKNVRLIVHPPHRFATANREHFTHVTIDAFKGRTLDAKRQLYKTIVANLTPLGIPADQIEIILREMERENFGIRGGEAACDVDLGFKVEV
jgi:phenylpyruvate tautomerase PptA (4-oxalocrotonate tautomerase family)